LAQKFDCEGRLRSMKKLVCLAIAVILSSSVLAQAKTILPDSCGDDSVKFDVDLKKDQPPSTPPDAGKAQIVFIQNSGQYDHFVPPIRFGMDGAWVGANKNNSYFVVNVDPGEHHLCTSLQMGGSKASLVKSSVQMATFTAEAGKTYYWEAAITFNGGVGSHNGGSETSVGFTLTQLTDDVGKYRVKAWKFAVFKQGR